MHSQLFYVRELTLLFIIGIRSAKEQFRNAIVALALPIGFVMLSVIIGIVSLSAPVCLLAVRILISGMGYYDFPIFS